jgi:ArsR family metal-binding transcriptional regulator
VTALQIYGWLPKSNCKACGEATCLAFAVKLLHGEQKLENCRPLLSEHKYAENRNIMQEMIEALGL